MFVYIAGKVKDLHKIDFVRFCIVGTLGFIINFSLLTVFFKVLGFHIFVSQLLSSEIALFNNLLIQFHMSSWSAILGSAAIVTLSVRVFHLHYLVALVIASAVGLMWNF